ncbi:two-component system response regulator [Microlunatus phosphovorus NM-1]|uniref:Two-component system response regulator n=1 Tax=Microlunatus phosphovorus (strain ATCC 700054 / DSM 10555 / JCM 9379 / NBRC 101784 / NCIMB 13414 / VKM Ac-1990 / NM-1) TaxID=1032480 RepID=F5XP47_MICPN|nr:response regulator transcription factor [Microlunatus phosphovorus]BAK36687.1 two-component system response regulator [Microlunatus phosphovorus NM-1]
MIRIVLVDDQELLRRGVRLLLEAAGGIEVVAEAADGHEALAMIAKHHPEVVLADAQMPGMGGVELVRRCGSEHPSLPVVILTTFDTDELVRDGVRAGAAGFLLKDVSPERLAEAIAAVRDGGVVIDPRVAGVALRSAAARGTAATDNADDPLALLTRTERLVATHVAAGRTNGEIAAELVLAEGTVKNHVSALLRKLAVRDRTALALLLSRSGL